MSSRPRSSDEPRVNEQIRTDKIRLIGADGEMVGVVTVREGILLAQEAGLDLVEISPNAEPPVCKILDYGKYKYEEQKKAAVAKKKQRVIHIKEIKLRPMIDPHDLEIKLRAINKFLDAGDKVKITLRFRGREAANQKIGLALLDKVKAALAEKIRVESEPNHDGRNIVMVIAPK